MSIVPKKYHTFISPPLRRVFLGDAREDNNNSRAVIENLGAQIAELQERVMSLNHDKLLLMDRCESAQSALVRLRSDERAARLANRKAKAEALVDKRNLDLLRAECDNLKSR